ncbi:IMPACT family protein [Muriicola soli]|uniref:YigZ family protein n=1 Tax=Muriicola soli TaxID=2507538 RepID=A0A411EA24_9FLAO|nr:YigZ family protein [Muriicola soli]QBA64384.1 YigZ family protein [Muriicola soli]
MASDQYKTISSSAEGLIHKDRNSKFLGFAYPVSNEEEIKTILAELRQQHKGANHVCYAWQMGVEPHRWRANDDGEPNNSAGLPIYGQIQAYGITDVLVAVVRFFGGTKLGVGGLISAYKQTAQMTLEEVRIITKTVFSTLIVEFDYQAISSVMRLIKKNQLQFHDQTEGTKAQYTLEVPRNKLMVIKKKLEAIKGVQLSTPT